MVRFAAGLSLLTLIFAVCLFALRSRATPNASMMRLDPGDCVMPCWMGIRPGETSMTEAATRLVRNPWIDPRSIRPFNDTGISFTLRWRDRTEWGLPPPDPKSPNYYDIVVFSNVEQDQVGYLIVAVAPTLPEFLYRYGRPDYSRIDIQRTGSARLHMYQALVYRDFGLVYTVATECSTFVNLVDLRGDALQIFPVGHPALSEPIGGIYQIGWPGLSPRPLVQFARRNGC